MKALLASIPGLIILEPVVRVDERGWFFESWNQKTLGGLGIEACFVQDNHSRSSRGTLRGLHYQVHHVQDKLVRVVVGSIFDVAVDVRAGSPTFGRWFGVELSAENRRQLWIPKGFAHGFIVTSEIAEVIYKVTDYWNKDAERGLRWNDPGVGIAWPATGGQPALNARDAAYPLLNEITPVTAV